MIDFLFRLQLEEEAKSNEDETLSTVAAKKPGKKQKTTKQSTADELNEIFSATEQDQHLAKTRGGKSTQMKVFSAVLFIDFYRMMTTRTGTLNRVNEARRVPRSRRNRKR